MTAEVAAIICNHPEAMAIAMDARIWSQMEAMIVQVYPHAKVVAVPDGFKFMISENPNSPMILSQTYVIARNIVGTAGRTCLGLMRIDSAGAIDPRAWQIFNSIFNYPVSYFQQGRALVPGLVAGAAGWMAGVRATLSRVSALFGVLMIVPIPVLDQVLGRGRHPQA